MLPFWISILLLSLGQGLLVAVPGVLRLSHLERLRSRWWAVIPALSVIAFVFAVRALEQAAEGLTYLALVAVPILALVALAWLARGGRPLLGLLVLPLFALAWSDPRGLAGEAASIVLSGLSCVALGVLIASVTPGRWLAVGIVAMAIADTALVTSDLLQSPNEALNGIQPVAHLPSLQDATFGSAVMGYGDLFVAAVLGALLATRTRAQQLRGALLAACLASAFDLLFFFVHELPATVPIALTLILLAVSRRLSARARLGLPAGGTPGPALKPQVYIDERPPGHFRPFYERARAAPANWIYELARLIFTPLCMILYRTSALDARRVPGSGPVIITPNHFSAMDHFLCGIYLRRRVRFMAKSQLFKGPLAILLPWVGAFPVQRGKHDEQAIATALEILRQGGAIVMYPEGGRSRSGLIGERARPGIGRLALESGAPVVPVAIHGSSRARDWKRLDFPRVTVRYGEPMRFARRSPSTPEAQQAVADDVLGNIRELYLSLEARAGLSPGPAAPVARPPAVT